MSVCTSVKKVDSLGDTDLLEVVIDSTTCAYWLFPYADGLKYVNQEVVVSYRKDIYKGQIKPFINTFIVPTEVKTISKKEGFRLYLDQEDNQSNISFNEVQEGETRSGAIVLCTSQSFGSSAFANWMQLIIRDRTMHVARLKLFDPKYFDLNFAGTYVVAELTRDSYGFKTQLIGPAPGEYHENEEIVVAQEFIKNFFADDSVALDFINRLNLFDKMKEHVDYELGYSTVRLAMELAEVQSLYNITKDVDIQAIGNAVLASYGYLVKESLLSSTVNNIFIAQQFAWRNKPLVIQLLDIQNEKSPKEVDVYKNIKRTVDTILEIRKGV